MAKNISHGNGRGVIYEPNIKSSIKSYVSQLFWDKLQLKHQKSTSSNYYKTYKYQLQLQYTIKNLLIITTHLMPAV